MSFLREGSLDIHSVFVSPLEMSGSRITAQIYFITYEGILKLLILTPRKLVMSPLAYAKGEMLRTGQETILPFPCSGGWEEP